METSTSTPTIFLRAAPLVGSEGGGVRGGFRGGGGVDSILRLLARASRRRSPALDESDTSLLRRHLPSFPFFSFFCGFFFVLFIFTPFSFSVPGFYWVLLGFTGF